MGLVKLQEKFMGSAKVEALEEKLFELFSTTELCVGIDADLVALDTFKALSPQDLHLMRDVKEVLGEEQYEAWVKILMRNTGACKTVGV
jgi:hypothetical protein